jgi:hypothetical protein
MDAVPRNLLNRLIARWTTDRIHAAEVSSRDRISPRLSVTGRMTLRTVTAYCARVEGSGFLCS